MVLVWWMELTALLLLMLLLMEVSLRKSQDGADWAGCKVEEEGPCTKAKVPSGLKVSLSDDEMQLVQSCGLLWRR